MKLRRLQEIDLARVAVLSRSEKRRALEAYNAGGGGWSYDPARAEVFNVFNPEDALGLRAAQPSLDQIIEEIRKTSYLAEQAESCIEVTELLWEWSRQHVARSVEQPIPSMPIGAFGAVRYWSNFVSLVWERPTFFYFDHRRARGLTKSARRFVMSMMNEHIRMTYPQFAEARLIVMRFPQDAGEDASRYVDFNDERGVEFYDLETLQGMIAETYEVWSSVLEARQAESAQGKSKKKKASGGFWD